MKYTVVLEKTETGYSAYVPDLPGCVSVGGTREEMDRNIRPHPFRPQTRIT